MANVNSTEEINPGRSFLSQVVDGLDDLISGGCREQLDCIHQQLRKGVQIGVISKTFPVEVLRAALSWLQHPIFRAVTAKNMPASSVCITQLVSVVTTEEAKLSKVSMSDIFSWCVRCP